MRLVEFTPMAEHAIVQKLASYFKVPKKEIKGQPAFELGFAEEKCPVLTYPRLEPNGFNEVIYPVTSSKLNLNELFYWDKFEKSGVYDAFLRGVGYVPEDRLRDYVMSLYLTGMVWMVYQTDDWIYDGKGGIVLKKSSSERFVVEPFLNYMQHQHELPEG